MSWATDMSPTAWLSHMSEPARHTGSQTVVGGVYPGCGMRVGTGVGIWEGYTGTQALPSQDPYLVYI